MILQAETALTTDQYNAILASKGEMPAYRTLLYRVMPVLTQVTDSESDGPFESYPYYDFGVCATNEDEVIRLCGDGSFSRYNWGGLGTWDYFNVGQLDNRDISIALSLVPDGADTVAYGVATDGIYKRVYSGGSWGSWTQIVSSTTVIAMSATALDSVYYAEYDSTFHSRFKHWNGTTSVDSGIYWPYKITSMAAATASDGRDVVAITSPMPGVLKYRYTNNQVIKEITRSYGVSSFMVDAEKWSDHREIDFILESSTAYRFRSALKFSTFGGEIFLTAYSRNGTQDHVFDGYRVWSTLDGEHWSRSEFISLPAGFDIYGVELERLGDTLFAMNGGTIYVGDSTIYFNHAAPDTVLDLSPEVLSLSLDRGDIAQVSIELTGATGWFDPSILSQGGRFWITVEVGEWINGEACYFPAGTFEVDNNNFVTTLPQVGIKITGRDFLAWMTDFSEVEDVKNWAPQILGGDKYQDSTGSGYGGMGHTQVVDGTWRTASNTLRNVADSEEGITFNTFPTDVVSPTELWNFRTSIGFQLAKAANNEYAGLVFRGQDKDNLWYAVYQQNIDKLQIIERRAGVNYTRATSASTLSWSTVTLTSPRYLMVTQQYSVIKVYTSTDNKTWDLNLTYIADGEAGTYYPQTGYCGVIGKGFSDEGSWDFDFEWPTIGIPTVEFDLSIIRPGQTPISEQIQSAPKADKEYPLKAWALDARSAKCAIVTGLNPGTSTLTTVDRSTGLSGKGRAGAQDFHSPGDYYALMSTGLYKNSGLFGSGVWTLVATQTTICGASGRECYFMAMPKEAPEGYIACWGHNNLFCFSLDYGVTWQQRLINTGIDSLETNYSYVARTTSTTSHDYNKCISVAFSPYNNKTEGWVTAIITHNNGTWTPIATADGAWDTWSLGVHVEGGVPFFSTDWGDTWSIDPYWAPSSAADGRDKIGAGLYWPKKTYDWINVYPASDLSLIFENRHNQNCVNWAAGYSNFFGWLTACYRVRTNDSEFVWDFAPFGTTGTLRPSWLDIVDELPTPAPLGMCWPDSLNGSFAGALVVIGDDWADPRYCGFLPKSVYRVTGSLPFPAGYTYFEGDVVDVDENNDPLMYGADPFAHRVVHHKYDDQLMAWWTCFSDQNVSQHGKMRITYDGGYGWTGYLQESFTTFQKTGTDVAIAFFEFDYTANYLGASAGENKREYFDYWYTPQYRGWSQFSPALSNGTKTMTVTTDEGLTGTITSEGGSLRDIDKGLVVYRATSALGTLPLYFSFGFEGSVSIRVWQGIDNTGTNVSKIIPDTEGRYKITKPYVYVQWFDVTPNGIRWYEVKT